MPDEELIANRDEKHSIKYSKYKFIFILSFITNIHHSIQKVKIHIPTYPSFIISDQWQVQYPRKVHEKFVASYWFTVKNGTFKSVYLLKG